MLLLLMMRGLVAAVAVGGAWASDPEGRDACTTILVGANATTFGGTVVTHTADCYNCDSRVAKVSREAQRSNGEKHTEHTVRRFRSTYPGEVSDRSATWSAKNLEYPSLDLDAVLPPFSDEALAAAKESVWGSDDWVESTVAGFVDVSGLVGNDEYGSLEALYGIANEAGLAIGESTCEGVFIGKVQRTCGTCEGPLFDVVALTKVAMRYCATAVCAVELMGALAEREGYYGAELNNGEAGEALMVADGAEAWVFHILPDDTGLSALWAATRLPADGVSVVANAFIIRGVAKDAAGKKNPDWRASANLEEVGIRSGMLVLTKEDGLVDFAASFGPRDTPDSLAKSPYSTHRVWRVLSLAAPEATRRHVLEAPERDYLGSELPFAVRTERKLTVADVLEMNRDHFEGTPFDMTKGLWAGAWGDPSRFDVASNQSPVAVDAARSRLPDPEFTNSGRFERGISIFRTAYSYAAVSTKAATPDAKEDHPVVWIGPGPPHATIYTPLLVRGEVPPGMMQGSMFEVSWGSTWWAVTLVSNWMRANTFAFCKRDVQAAQKGLEARFAAKLADHPGDTRLNLQLHAEALETWAALFLKLVAKYRDNMQQFPAVSDVDMRKFFYPLDYLKAVGWQTPENEYYAEVDGLDDDDENNKKKKEDASTKKAPSPHKGVPVTTDYDDDDDIDSNSNYRDASKPLGGVPVWHYHAAEKSDHYTQTIAAFALGMLTAAVITSCVRRKNAQAED